MQRILVAVLVFAAAGCAGRTAVEGQGGDVREEFTAVALSAGGPLSNPVAAQLQITVDRWTTDEERERFMDALAKSQDAALEVLQKLPPAGGVRTPGTLRWALRYAHQVPLEDGGRQIFLATDRPMSFAETAQQTRTSLYPFTLIELRMDGKGRGEGKLSQAVRIRTTGNRRIVSLENYATEPVTLTEVRKR